MEHFSIVIVGHVDHGKSTLLGRLYADTGSLPDGKLEKVQAICRQQGKEFEYAFLFDAFLEEQEQGITIDTARTFFNWGEREYTIIDAPGHKEFIKNMVSGASRAEAALLVIDAHEGVQEQSRRHGYLLSLLGIRQMAVIVNKMDLMGYREDVYREVETEYRAFLKEIGVAPERFVPVSAKLGDNIAYRSERMPWYAGPTVLDTLGLFRKVAPLEQAPLRFPVQDVYKFDARRIIAGRISAGRLRVGDRLIFSPSNKGAVIRSVEAFNVEPQPVEASAGRSIGVTLDEQIFVERGEIAAHEEAPPQVADVFSCNLFWMGQRPLVRGRDYLLRLATREVPCRIEKITRIIDAQDLAAVEAKDSVGRNEAAEVTIRTRSPIAFDLYADQPITGRFVLVDEYDVAGGGIITEAVADRYSELREEARRRDLSWVQGEVTPEQRAEHYGHRAALVLVAGTAPSHEQALARRLENLLVADGRHAYLFEPDNLRQGLDAGLRRTGRQEAARRFGEVARLLLDTGLVVVSLAYSLNEEEMRTVQALVHPAPVLLVGTSEAEAGDGGLTALAIDPRATADEAAAEVIEYLKNRGILAHTLGERPRFRYANYSI